MTDAPLDARSPPCYARPAAIEMRRCQFTWLTNSPESLRARSSQHAWPGNDWPRRVGDLRLAGLPAVLSRYRSLMNAEISLPARCKTASKWWARPTAVPGLVPISTTRRISTVQPTALLISEFPGCCPMPPDRAASCKQAGTSDREVPVIGAGRGRSRQLIDPGHVSSRLLRR